MIRLNNISKIFPIGDDTSVRAIDDVTLDIAEGEWCNLIGPNGAGKSTLLRIVSGDISPSSGNIIFDQKDITFWNQAKRARIFQFIEQDTMVNLVPSMTVSENLLLSLNGSRTSSLRLLKQKDHIDKVLDCLKTFQMDLGKKISTQVRLLSGGERQAIVLAKTILSNTKVLLLDEFLGNIDPKTAPVLLDIVKSFSIEQKIAVIMVSHDLDHVKQTKGRILMLSKGRILNDIPNSSEISKEDLIKLYKQTIEDSGRL